MADLSINMLPVSDGLDDDSLLPVYQYNRAHKIRGQLIKQFARASVEEYVSAAQDAAEQAEQAAKDAQAAADSVAYVTEKAEEAAQAALAAQQAKEAAETARDEAQAIAGGDFLERPTYDPQGRKQDIFAYVDDIAKGKVSVADIIDNLTTNVANKPLSAAQGVALKALIDALTTTVSGKAPTSHASTATTYGAGTGSNYGHVKLSDSTSGTSNANGGVAATPAAVKAAYDLANGKAAASHNQAASTITAGTFAGQVVANGSGQTPGASLLRNSRLVSADTNPTVNGEINWTYK